MASVTGASPYCVPCERLEHWLEIVVRDEFNQPFDNIKGTLFDPVGNEHAVVVGEAPILVKTLAPGIVTLTLDAETWLKDAQKATHKPNPDSAPVKDFAATYQGHENSTPTYYKVTAGDLTTLPDGVTLPPNHQAGKADSFRFITDFSYVLEVKGFNYLTLRLGMFFDGTANNTYSAQWGKRRLEGDYTHWLSRYHSAIEAKTGRPASSVSDFPAKDLPPSCFVFPDDEKFHFFWEEDYAVDSSAANELTNIQKLYERYLLDKYVPENHTFVHPEYITGIGTGNETAIAPADESVLEGQALGLGDYGVTAKVTTGIEHICNSIKTINTLTAFTALYVDGFRKLELDVFGFSRGAAAARHFINVALDGEQGEFALAFTQACQDNQLALMSGFDWADNACCTVTFAGLFDTVASIADIYSGDFTAHNTDNGDVRLWLDPDRVERAVHLTAAPTTEYRYNFCLNKLNAAENFEEYVLPGAHSDIGGGYHSRYSYTGKHDFLLPLLEKQCIKRVSTQYSLWGRDKAEAHLTQQLLDYQQANEALGWQGGYNITFTEKQGRERTLLVGELYVQRVVEGDLSRLYLRVMYGLAEYYKVPVSDDSLQLKGTKVWQSKRDINYIVPHKIQDLPFGKLCDEVLSAAKQGEVHPVLMEEGTEARFMETNLIHHSADRGIANKPHMDETMGRFYRERFECKKES